MRPISIKLDEDTIEVLDEEADERDLTRSQYLRRIIDARHERSDGDLAERVQRLEAVVLEHEPAPELHSEEEPEPAPEPVEVTDKIEAAVGAAAANWEDSSDRIEQRKAAARAVLSELRERPLSKSEIIEEIEPAYPVEGQSKRTWWRNNLSECEPSPLKELAEYSNATKKWTWSG